MNFKNTIGKPGIKAALGLFLAASPLLISAQKAGINFSHIDSSANPCNDFYTFCNGNWQKKFQLPASDARYGSFNEINENNLSKIRDIYSAAAANKSATLNSDAQRLRDFYNTAMDSSKADLLGAKPVAAQMAMIDKVNNLGDFMKLKAEFESIGVNLLFGSGVSADLKNSKKNTFGIGQAGFGLGDRDYYHSAQFADIRTQYQKYLSKLFVLSGTPAAQADQMAAQVLNVETRITDKAFTRVQMRDVEKLYNVFNPSDLKTLTPALNWDIYFKQKNMRMPDTINVAMVDYMRSASDIVTKLEMGLLKTYAKGQLLMEAAPYLSQAFVDASFEFRGKTMSGAKIMKARWQRVHNVMNGSIGEIVSKEFVKLYFPPEAKEKVNTLIDNLVLAYRERIASRDWMSAETKKQANRKLDLLIRKVGYPDKWKSYEGLEIGTDNYWNNVCRVNTFLVKDNLADLNKPVDRTKWQMTPVTVNAYYDPTTNEITFPAAILQPPFFDPAAEDAANYGTMGSIIGHELTHGFDDQGAQFDADGNMMMWWTENDFKNFKDKTGQIVKQFNNYVAIDTLRVNGSMTQGENIADLGGLTMAYYAYKKSLNGKKSNVMGGYTGEQRFFIAWAQGWKSVTRDEELKRLLTVDYHSPAYFRAFAPLTNMKEFYEAFHVKAGDKMFTPESERVEIW
jgi:putative endopeptidase